MALFLEGKGGELLDGAPGADEGARRRRSRFEEAARLRDQLFAIERSLERQTVATTEPIDQDVFGYHREADRLLVYVLYVRQGRLNGGQAFPFTGQEFPDEELLGSFVNLYYGEDNLVPDEVLLPLAAGGRVRGAGGAAHREAGPAGAGARAAARREAPAGGDGAAERRARRFSEQRRSARRDWRRSWSGSQDRLHLSAPAAPDGVLRHLALPGQQHRRQPGGDDRRRAGQVRATGASG